MTIILKIISEYYLVFDIISIFLILSLIGFFVSRKKEKEIAFKIDASNISLNASSINNTENKINTNMSLQDLVKENKNINNGQPNRM